MQFVKLNLCHFRSTLITRFCPVVQTKLFSFKRNFADDAKKKNNLYEILGIRPSSSLNEIKKAYYDLTFKYHPDRNVDSKEAATKFREVTEAYEILGSYSLRKKYDRGIPVSEMKKTVRPSVEHKAKFQEFLDSRFADHKSSSDSRSKEIDDLSTYSDNKELKDKKSESDYHHDTHGSRVLFTIIFILLMLLVNK